MSEFTKKLKAAGKAWGAAKDKAAKSGTRNTEFEDGRYMTRLTKGYVNESTSSGRLQITWVFTFQDGEYEGQNKLDFSGLESEQNLEYLARRLMQLGYEAPESLDEIEDILEDVNKTKPICKIRLKSKGDFQNVYIDKVFAAGGEEDDDEAGTEEEEEAPAAPAPKTKGTKGTKAAPPVEEEEEEAAVEEEDVVEEEEVAEDESDDAVELAVGMTVVADTSKGELTGEVLEILEAEGKVRVKLADGKVVRVPVDKLTIDETVPDEPKTAPKATTKKRR